MSAKSEKKKQKMIEAIGRRGSLLVYPMANKAEPPRRQSVHEVRTQVKVGLDLALAAIL